MLNQQAIPHRAQQQIGHDDEIGVGAQLSARDPTLQDLQQGIAAFGDQYVTQNLEEFVVLHRIGHQPAHRRPGDVVQALEGTAKE